MDERVEQAAAAGVSVLAKLTRRFYEELRTQGFTEEQAMTLTHTYLSAIRTLPSRSRPVV